MEEVVHIAHVIDGYPLCWSMDQDGPHTVTRRDEDVTCEDCRGFLKEIQ
jgi:hypothetical protein